MSLQLAAQHLASRGRGPDTQLIHMAPQEVAGLHALAKAHGGSLTINPDTGLAEAGFLSKLLPTLIGVGLSVASGGALTPLMAAGITGAGYGVATGSLQKGLMAGLGAYGGAGLAGGLMSAGAAGAAEAGAAGLGAMGPQTAAQLGTGLEASMAAQGISPTLGATGASMGAQTASQMGAGFQADMAAQGIQPSPITADLAIKNAVPTVTQAPVSVSDRFSQAFQGAKNLGTSEGRDLFMGNAASKGVEAQGVGGLRGLTQYGLMGLGPAVMDAMTPKQREIAKQEELKAKNYQFAYNPVADVNQGYTGAYTGERRHLNPTYTEMPVTAAGGGLMDIQPIETMSQQNQSQMRPAYAQGGVSDMAVNPYTGSESFAEGGDTKAIRPVEEDPYNTMTGESAGMYKYLMGQQPTSPRTAAAAAAPAPAPAAPTGFLSNITGFASPEGIVSIDTGKLTPWSASNPKPTGGGFFGGPETAVAPAPGARFGSFLGLGNTVSPAAQAAGGEWVDDTSSLLKSYDFDPVSGMMTAKAAPKIWKPYAAPATTTGLSYENMSGGAANGGLMSLAQGGQSHLGDYSDGGRLLRGPGDGVSDSIPASIGDKRPARLADGEFVVPARIVSELGNGSTEAGARKLYAMMDRVQKARAKTTGKNRVAANTKAERLLPV